LDWGARWVIYWQLFDKPVRHPDPIGLRDDCYCLIRWDGSQPLLYYYMKDLMVGSP